ncbi:MAG: IS630 transposase-related protein [Dysgonomonas sp.]
MAKYNEKLTMKIVRFIESGTYSISEICNTLNIHRKTFYEWRNTKPEFGKKIEDAIERRYEASLAIARASTKKKREKLTKEVT